MYNISSSSLTLDYFLHLAERFTRGHLFIWWFCLLFLFNPFSSVYYCFHCFCFSHCLHFTFSPAVIVKRNLWLLWLSITSFRGSVKTILTFEERCRNSCSSPASSRSWPTSRWKRWRGRGSRTPPPLPQRLPPRLGVHQHMCSLSTLTPHWVHLYGLPDHHWWGQNIRIYNTHVYDIIGYTVYTGYTTQMHMYNIPNRRYFVWPPGRVRMLGIDFEIHMFSCNLIVINNWPQKMSRFRNIK